MEAKKLCRSSCNTCSTSDLGVMYQHPQLADVTVFECRRCDPDAFERAARLDIDAWLSGGEAAASA